MHFLFILEDGKVEKILCMIQGNFFSVELKLIPRAPAYISITITNQDSNEVLFKSFLKICKFQLCWLLWGNFTRCGDLYANHQN